MKLSFGAGKISVGQYMANIVTLLGDANSQVWNAACVHRVYRCETTCMNTPGHVHVQCTNSTCTCTCTDTLF